jgi:predicted transposase YdaD
MMSERRIMNEGMEGRNGRTEGSKEGRKKWMNEWMNERMNECKKKKKKARKEELESKRLLQSHQLSPSPIHPFSRQGEQ